MNSKKLRILFQEPYVPENVSFGRYSGKAGNAIFPYGVASIARYLTEREYDVEYLDPSLEGMGQNDYISFLKNNHFDVIGIGATTLQIDFALETFRIIKEKFPNIHTILGGVHGTLLPRQTMESCKPLDFLVVHEAEKPLLRILDCLETDDIESIKGLSGVCSRHKNEIVCNSYDYSDRLSSEEISIPFFELLPMERYRAQVTFSKAFPTYSIIASRGCPFKCTFCNGNSVLGKKVRYKPVETVLQEIRLLKQTCGAKGIMFHDSTFTVNKKWVGEFCKAYKNSDLNLPWSCNSRADTIDETLVLEMKQAGCWLVSFGIESGNQKSLDLIKKGTTVQQNERAVKMCLEKGLCVNGNYILCLPGEKEEDVINTIKVAKKLGTHTASFNLPVPFPGTELRETCKKTGIVRGDAKWSDYQGWDFSNPLYINEHLGKDKMKQLRSKAYKDFYRDPVVCYRNMKEVLLLRQSPSKYWEGFKSILSSLRQ